MPSPSWIDPFLDMASGIYRLPALQWIDDSPRFEDVELLTRESELSSAIDTINFRKEVIEMWKRKEMDLYVRELPGMTRVLFIGTSEQYHSVPWEFWSRIYQAIGYPIGYTLFYAHPSVRSLPSNKTIIQARDINGGYSYLCDHRKVVIYRFEECTRVLLHELLHTACFDKDKLTEDLESNTEAWTEVFLCALLSKGTKRTFIKLWSEQLNWIQRQYDVLERMYSVHSRNDYAWRYITGKYDVLVQKGFILPSTTLDSTVLSLRFTTPSWDTYF